MEDSRSKKKKRKKKRKRLKREKKKEEETESESESSEQEKVDTKREECIKTPVKSKNEKEEPPPSSSEIAKEKLSNGGRPLSDDDIDSVTRKRKSRRLSSSSGNEENENEARHHRNESNKKRKRKKQRKHRRKRDDSDVTHRLYKFLGSDTCPSAKQEENISLLNHQLQRYVVTHNEDLLKSKTMKTQAEIITELLAVEKALLRSQRKKEIARLKSRQKELEETRSKRRRAGDADYKEFDEEIYRMDDELEELFRQMENN